MSLDDPQLVIDTSHWSHWTGVINIKQALGSCTTGWGVTLAQLVKASVGQSDVRRFEPHLGHNLLSCGVFHVKSRHFGLPLAQTIMAKLAISLSGWLGRYTNVEYLQSLYLKRRGQLLFQVWAGYNTTLPFALLVVIPH